MTSSNLLAAVAPGSAEPLSRAFDLPFDAPPPALVGIVVGAAAGVTLFMTVVALVAGARRRRRARAQRDPDQVVYIAPYATHPGPMHAAPPPPVTPSSEHSARAFAKMGFAFGQRVDPHAVDPFEAVAARSRTASAELDETAEAIRVSVSETQPMVALKPHVPPRNPDESAPNPLAVIPASSSAMIRAAEVSPPVQAATDLDYGDQGDTQIGEPFFEEPPRPRATSRPKIRPIPPAPPRFGGPLSVATAPAPLRVPPAPATPRSAGLS